MSNLESKLETLRSLLADERLKEQHAERNRVTHARAIVLLTEKVEKIEKRIELERQR